MSTPETKRRKYEDDPDMIRQSLMIRRQAYQFNQQNYETAAARMEQLFELTFANPEAAKVKFTKLVARQGLRMACHKMRSTPTRIVPAWKQLRGKISVFQGPDRERERAQELLSRLALTYRTAEDARHKRDLSADMYQQAQDRQNWGFEQQTSQGQDTGYSQGQRRKLKQKR